MKIVILPIKKIKSAIKLIIKVFNEFVAPDYSKEGIKEFYKFLSYEDIIEKVNLGRIRFYGCFYEHRLRGVIATKEINHICLLFVKKEFQRKNIARNLINEVIKESLINHKYKITVNSSPYAVKIYKHMGFVKTDDEQIVKGIKFYPMELNVRKFDE